MRDEAIWKSSGQPIYSWFSLGTAVVFSLWCSKSMGEIVFSFHTFEADMNYFLELENLDAHRLTFTKTRFLYGVRTIKVDVKLWDNSYWWLEIVYWSFFSIYCDTDERSICLTLRFLWPFFEMKINQQLLLSFDSINDGGMFTKEKRGYYLFFLLDC